MKLALLITLALLSTARADSVEDRLSRLEAAVFGTPPATQPTTPQPATPVRADTAQAVKAAIASGATWIETTGIDLNDSIDAKGATIELLPGGPGWKPAVQMNADASLSNATLKTPPSTYNAAGQRTSFWKALAANGRVMMLRNVTFAPDTGFCIHLGSGQLDLIDVKASTFSEYFMFEEAGTMATAKGVQVIGGSRAESVWRALGARYVIEDSTLDNSRGGKAALRGDSPAMPDGSPGGIVRRTRIVGQVGPNPLTEDDGGQMIGIDRWRYAEGWLYQLPYSRNAEAVAFAQAQRAAGMTPADIVRACADRFIDPVQFAKVARGRTKVSDNDISLTLAFRTKEVGRSSTFLIDDCDIIGDLRINARMSGTVRRTKITGNPPISGNSQPTYPWPTNRVIVTGEAAPAPAVTFEAVQFNGGSSIGIDLTKWTSLKFDGSTYKGAAIAQTIGDQ